MIVVACLQWMQRPQVCDRTDTAGSRGCEQVLGTSVTEALVTIQCSRLTFTGCFDVRSAEALGAVGVISDESTPLKLPGKIVSSTSHALKFGFDLTRR